MVDRHLDGVVHVHVDEAQSGVVNPVPDHDEGVAVIPKEPRSVVVRENLGNDDAVHLAAPEYSQEIGVVQRTRDDVDRVSGVLNTEGRRHDHMEVRRVEVLRHVDSDEAAST